MSLTEQEIEAAFASARPVSRGCKLGDILTKHPALESKVMAVERFDAATVARVLTGLGLPVSRDVVSRHRKGACSCTGRGQR